MNKEIECIALEILKANAMEIRDIDSGQEAFLYASGNWGPGYVSIKNLVGRKYLIKMLVRVLAEKLIEESIYTDFVAGNVTGGVVPGWLLSEEFGFWWKHTVPFVYIRDARKKGGQKELITGIADNPEIVLGQEALVVEELVNFAETICNSAIVLRQAGYKVTHGATILFYNNPESVISLGKHGIQMTYLLTLTDLLNVAEKNKIYPARIIDDYHDFLRDPLGWQEKRGLKPVKEGGTK